MSALTIDLRQEVKGMTAMADLART